MCSTDAPYWMKATTAQPLPAVRAFVSTPVMWGVGARHPLPCAHQDMGEVRGVAEQTCQSASSLCLCARGFCLPSKHSSRSKCWARMMVDSVFLVAASRPLLRLRAQKSAYMEQAEGQVTGRGGGISRGYNIPQCRNLASAEAKPEAVRCTYPA